jgi:hypothetical protein
MCFKGSGLGRNGPREYGLRGNVIQGNSPRDNGPPRNENTGSCTIPIEFIFENFLLKSHVKSTLSCIKQSLH